MYLLTVHVETFSGDDLLRREGCPGVQEQAGHQVHNGESNFQLVATNATNATNATSNAQR